MRLRKSDANVKRWSPLIVAFSFVLIISWFMTDFATQWVLIEVCTLIGALLISMSQNEKATNVAWKFLFSKFIWYGHCISRTCNSFSRVYNVISMNIDVIMEHIQEKQNPIIEVGIWLVVFGYSTKLGLFPNQYWVSDTYWKVQVKYLPYLPHLIPVSVSIAIRPIVKWMS